MIAQEFSDEFDVLVNSYAHRIEMGNQISSADIAFDEYEKSVFLTKGQEEEVIALYSGRNTLGSSFEETEEFRRYLSNLVEEATLSPLKNNNGQYIGVGGSKFFSLPENPSVWFITYESFNTSEGTCTASGAEIVPVTQDEYHKVKNNPFRGPSERRALRLDLSNGIVELVSKADISSYYVRYIRKPHPIILTTLTEEGLTIDGESSPYNPVCELHEALHKRILDRAVLLALQSKIATARKDNSA